MNSSEKKNRSADYLGFFYQYVNSFSKLLLLCKIDVRDIFIMDDFFRIYVISRSIDILIEFNF